MCGDVTQQQWVGVKWYLFTVGRCQSLGCISEWQSSQCVVERNSNGGSTREGELKLKVAVTVSDRVLSSDLSVGDSYGKFVDLWRLKVWLEGIIHVCVIQWDCYSSCIIMVVPGEDQCVCKSVIAPYCLYLSVIKRERLTEVLINPIIRNRTRHFSYTYHPTRDNIICVPHGYPNKTATVSLNSINRLGFVAETYRVSCNVRTCPLYIIRVFRMVLTINSDCFPKQH
jgi:hypothetical protein